MGAGHLQSSLLPLSFLRSILKTPVIRLSGLEILSVDAINLFQVEKNAEEKPLGGTHKPISTYFPLFGGWR